MTHSFLPFRPARNYEDALNRAAELWGIEPAYHDVMGQNHVTPAETKKAILAARGVKSGSKAELDAAVEKRLFSEWSRLAPPVAVLTAGAPLEIPLHAARELRDAEVALELRLEEGGREQGRFQLSELRETGTAELCRRRFSRRALPLRPDLPLGYHHARVTLAAPGAGPREAEVRLIICPERTYVPPLLQNEHRAAGLAISLYGLRSHRNWGVGDFTDLEQFLDWMADEARAAFVGLNPLHSIPNRQPFNTSPYLPTSIFYKNPIYIDVERVGDYHDSRRARRLAALPETRAEIGALRAAEHIEYERVYGLKSRFLKLAFLEFLAERRRGSPRAREFDRYIEREGEMLERYAVYSALDEWIRARNPEIWVWPDWPAEYQDPDSEATRAFAKKHWRLVLFHKYVQWIADRQLSSAQEYAARKGLAIGLYHDLALATDRCGGDLWAYRPFYVSGCRVGAPPDDFSPNGQDWSFPPPDSDHHRETGYALFAESIRKNCRHGGALRIDHVMRFFRLYWIPEGMEPGQGAYVREHHHELLPILALESVRNKVIVVGEDLGTVTADIREALDRYGLFGYKVPYFEKNYDGRFKPPGDYSPRALVSSTTHDLPTLAGFWQARDIEARRQAKLIDDGSYRRQLASRAHEKQKILDLLLGLGLLPDWFPRSAADVPELTGELHNAFVGFLATAQPRLMVLAQEDLFKDLDQQNLPASTWQYPNWRHKMRFAIEELRTARFARDCTAMLRRWLERTGRANQPV